MIRQSFIFLDNINQRKEKNIWKQGIKDWNDFLENESIKNISKKRKKFYDKRIIEAKKELYDNDAEYFSRIMPAAEHWRLYDYFKDECVFLDIETSGVNADGYITVVGLYDGYETKTMVRGINLNSKQLKEELRKYKMIVTFNGSTFDLPYISKKFPSLLPNIPHLDLRHACKRVGLDGGLKQIEKRMGIKRKNKVIERLYGGDAYTLWRMFVASGDDYYLNLLVEYNEEDVVNLRQIADHVVRVMKKNILTY